MLLSKFHQHIKSHKGIAVVSQVTDDFSVDAAILPKDTDEQFEAALIRSIEAVLDCDIKLVSSEAYDYGFATTVTIAYERDGEDHEDTITLTHNAIF